MKLFTKEPVKPEAPPKDSSEFRRPCWPLLLNLGLVALFGAALAVQLGRGKLWIVGPVGVWLLFVLALLATLLRPVFENPSNTREKITIWTQRIYRGITPYGLVVVVLTVFGLWLRVWGQKNGLPYSIPADESLLVDVGPHILKTGDLDPQMFYYPSFYPYQEALVGTLQFLWGNLTGLYHGLDSLPDRTYAITTAPQMYLWERTYTALWGTAAIPLAYFVVKKIWLDRRAGLLAAGFVAFSALATEHSHYVAVDMPMATLTLAALLPAWNIFKRGRPGDYAWSGVLVGLALATKWNGGVALVLPLTAQLLRALDVGPAGLGDRLKRLFVPKLGLALLWAGLVTVVTNPFIFSRVKAYSDAFGANLTKYRLSTVGYATDTPWLSNLQVIWNDSLWLALLAGGGMLLLAFRRRPNDLLALSFPLAYLLSINSYRLIYPRNVLPLTLFGAVFAGLFCVWVWDMLIAHRLTALKLKPVLTRYAGVAVPVIFLLLTMNGPLGAIFYGNQFNDQPFSYDRVESWLKSEVGPGPLKMVEMRPQQWGDYPNLLTRVAEQGVNDFPLQYYRERGIQYLAVNLDRVYTANGAGSYKELLQPGNVVGQFETKAVEKPGPAFAVVRTGVTTDTLKLQYPKPIDFGGQLRLLGLNAGRLGDSRVYLPPPGEITQGQPWPVFKPGETIGLSVYWQVLNRPDADYVVFIHLQPTGQPDQNLASRDTPPLQGLYPTGQWKPGEIVTDTPNLALPANLPPGEYDLVMGLYRPDGKFTPLPASDGKASVVIARLKVSK